jgi:hypothetical protein
MEAYPALDWEPESVDCAIALVGAGTGTPTRPTSSRSNYSIVRTGVGTITINLLGNDDFAPTVQGIAGFCFGDATATNVLGWTVCYGAFTARSGPTPAKFTFTIGNGSNAAADLASTSTLVLLLSVKLAPGVT